MSMKRMIFGLATLAIVFVAVLAVVGAHPVRKVKAYPGCSDSMLRGNYGWTEFGQEPESSDEFWTTTALVQFDGRGNFSANNIYYTQNGAPDPENPSTASAGSYSVKPNCTVTITYDWEGETYTDHGVVVGADASEVLANEESSESDTTGHVDLKKVADGDHE
jgi:hypothetical protein